MYVSVCARLSRWKAKNESRKRIHRKTTQEHPHIDIDNDNNITSWVKLFQCSDRVHVSCALLYSNFIYAIKSSTYAFFLSRWLHMLFSFTLATLLSGCFFRHLLSLVFFPFDMCVSVCFNSNWVTVVIAVAVVCMHIICNPCVLFPNIHRISSYENQTLAALVSYTLQVLSASTERK